MDKARIVISLAGHTLELDAWIGSVHDGKHGSINDTGKNSVNLFPRPMDECVYCKCDCPGGFL